MYIPIDDVSYLQHDAWFELDNLERIEQSNNLQKTIKGKRLINNYGRVREVWDDGTYYDVHNGKYEELSK